MIIMHTLKSDNPYLYEDDVDELEGCLEEALTVIVQYGGCTDASITFSDEPLIPHPDDPTRWAEGW